MSRAYKHFEQNHRCIESLRNHIRVLKDPTVFGMKQDGWCIEIIEEDDDWGTVYPRMVMRDVHFCPYCGTKLE